MMNRLLPILITSVLLAGCEIQTKIEIPPTEEEQAYLNKDVTGKWWAEKDTFGYTWILLNKNKTWEGGREWTTTESGTYNDDGFPDISLYFYDDNHTRLMHSFRVDLKNSRRVLISDNGTRYWQDTIQHRSLLRSVWEPESEEYEFKRIEFLPDTVCRLSVPIGVLWDKSPIMGSYDDTNYPYVLIYMPEEETGRPDEKRKLLFASDDLSVTVYGGRNAWGALHETIYRKQRFVAELE